MQIFIVQWDMESETGSEFEEGVALVRAESEARAQEEAREQIEEEGKRFHIHSVHPVQDGGAPGVIEVLSW